jgi:hypothetical protein
MAAVAGVGCGASLLTIGCSGDDSKVDGGDAKPDNTIIDSPSDVPTEAGPDRDAGSDGDATANCAAQFRVDLAKAICMRFQACCSNFDYNKCVNAATLTGWEYGNSDLSNPEILYGGNLICDTTAINQCIAGLATLSCPITSTSEFKPLTDNCFKAISGKLGAGANCLGSSECQSGMYCNTAVDAGTSDGGQQYGTCANILQLNAKCGQAPFGNTFSNVECAYKGWPPPNRFCKYDSYPNANGYFCDNLRANGTTCYANYECQSGLCADVADAGTCSSSTCKCSSSKSLFNFCKAFQIKDAGPG